MRRPFAPSPAVVVCFSIEIFDNLNYPFDANGSRIRAGQMASSGPNGQTQTQSFKEYTFFNGQTIAEKDQTGAWTDYVFAAGKRIAAIRPADSLIHFHGLNGGSTECASYVQLGGSYIIQPGDKINWRENKQAAVGGIAFFTDTFFSAWRFAYTNGITLNQDTRQGWVNRTVDLTIFAGHPLMGYGFLQDVLTGTNPWDIWYGDLVLESVDGTLLPLFTRGMSPTLSGTGCQGPNRNIAIEVQTPATAPLLNSGGVISFYVADHLGSAAIEFGAGGWPLSSTQYAPFGAELASSTPTSDHYKFTGKERDTESGLDYFGARYYGSSMGRFMSPDWAAKAEPVPYAKLSNPQSLNLYAYVGNNPLSNIDPDGHCCFAQKLWNWVNDDGWKSNDEVKAGAAARNAAWQAQMNAEGTNVTTSSTYSLSLGTVTALGLAAMQQQNQKSIDEAIDSILRPEGEQAAPIPEGSFSIYNWSGYPEGAPQPGGPFRLLEGEEYDAARSAANSANRAIRAGDPEAYAGQQIHEIQPVKFGGSPTDTARACSH